MNQRQRQNNELPTWFTVAVMAILAGLALYLAPHVLDGVQSLQARSNANRQAVHPTAVPFRVQAEIHEVTREVVVTRVVVQENIVEVTAAQPGQASSRGRADAPAPTTSEQRRQATKDLVDPAGQRRE